MRTSTVSAGSVTPGRSLRPGIVHVWLHTRRDQLHHVLAGYLSIDPSDVVMGRSSRGKPFVEGGEDLRFSATRSRDLSVVAVARGREVGVDIERLRPITSCEAVARRVLGEAEAERLSRLPLEGRDVSFLRSWTRNEATAKAYGCGLPGTVFSDDARAADIADATAATAPLKVYDLELPVGWIGSLAVEGGARRIWVHTGGSELSHTFDDASGGRAARMRDSRRSAG